VTSQPGEYCMRCGAKSDIDEGENGQVYVCPRGHGVQGVVAAAPEAEPEKEAEAEEEAEPAPRTAKSAKPPPPPHKAPARPAVASHHKKNKGTRKR
jgi:hypothetical protein